jgi:hypothetical protein
MPDFTTASVDPKSARELFAGGAHAYSVSSAGGELRLITSRKDRMKISVSDLSGRTLVSRIFSGGGVYSLGRIPGGGVASLTVESDGIVRREFVAGPSR